MFENYVKTAFRNLMRQKLFSTINIVGLAIGLAASILILLFVRDELSYDNFWAKKDQIYRMQGTVHLPGRTPSGGASSAMAPATPALLADFAEIANITRITYVNSTSVRVGNDQFLDNLMIADPALLTMFDFNVVEGSLDGAMDRPTNIILSRSMAQKYFGDTPAVGQTVFMTQGGDETFNVVAVIEDIPATSHLNFDLAVPMAPRYFVPTVTGRANGLENWGLLGFLTYIEFKSGVNVAAFSQQIPAFLDRHVPDTIREIVKIAPSELFRMKFIQLPDIHLKSLTSGTTRPSGDIESIYAFLGIAILIMGIAIINFINLSTAYASRRGKEVAVRKVVGAKRTDLMVQFLGEAGLMVFLALLLGLVLVEVSLPWYGTLTAKILQIDFANDPLLLMGLAGLAVVVGLGAGLYPAFVLSHFKPVVMLKSSGGSVEGNKGGLRWVLVVVQFAISIGLIAATAILYAQTRYTQTKELGFDKENVLVVMPNGDARFSQTSEQLMDRMKRYPDVVDVTKSSTVPGAGGQANTTVRLSDAETSEPIPLRTVNVDFNFFETLKMPIVAGRSFSEEYSSDITVDFGENDRREQSNAVINMRAVRILGFASAEDAIGKTILHSRNPVSALTIVGVVADAHFQSLRAEIDPDLYRIDRRNLVLPSLRVKAGRNAQVLEALSKDWEELFPNTSLQTLYMDEGLDQLYAQDKLRGMMLGTFAVLAVLVSCLGLLGLSSFTIAQRTKEIGLRKVMGASMTNIMRLLLWQFTKPVLIANIIAWPVVWYFMSEWLSGFVYRIDMDVLPFAIASVFALVIAWFTVGLHVLKTARSNPINALRHE